MRSGPQTSSAVTTMFPSPRTDTVALTLSSRNHRKAKEAVQSRRPCHRPPKTCSHTQPRPYKQNRTTTALDQQTRPPPPPSSSTVAQIHRQLRQRRALLHLTLQHQPHQTRDTARLPPPLSMLRLHQTHTPNPAPSLSPPPTLQRLLLCLPLWHRQSRSLRARPKPTPPDWQDRPQHRSMGLLQPGNLTRKPQNPSSPLPPTQHLPLHLPPKLHHPPPSPPPVVWRALRSLIPQFLALPLWGGG